nr:hypothetical protein [Weizmannia acidilactici]
MYDCIYCHNTLSFLAGSEKTGREFDAV